MREPTAAREDLERRWRSRLTREDAFARLVTAADARIEPYHRWLPFRQGFSPGLVRRFLNDVVSPDARDPDAPVLDPFSGTGTTVVECARAGVTAAGREASPALAFLTKTKFQHPFPAWTAPLLSNDWREIAVHLDREHHRAALILAVARQYTSAGRPNPTAPPLAQLLPDVIAMMRDDFRRPLGLVNSVTLGDARRADEIELESVRAILTSPPYLSRHDYVDITAPLEEVHRFWYTESHTVDSSAVKSDSTAMNAGHEPATATQLRASTKRISATRRKLSSDALPASSPSDGAHEVDRGSVNEGAFDFEPDAVQEVRAVLHSTGERKLATIAGSYFEDLRSVLRQCHRVLRRGSVSWFVIGGARLKGSYVPSDLIFAEQAEQLGFAVESILVARDLIHARRKFGRIGHIAPRESVVVIVKE